jgi:uncharacterized coiled-coil protein SlyX
MEKYWSMDETINQIKHLLLEKNAEIERLREALRVIRDELGDTPMDSMKAYEISDTALKDGE